MTDFSRIQPRHEAIDRSLTSWGRWITKTGRAWRVHPMFAQYRSHAWQWEQPEVHVPGDPQVHMRVEKMVSELPDKHRTAIRWCYAFPWVPVSAVRQTLGLTNDALATVLDDARDRLINR